MKAVIDRIVQYANRYRLTDVSTGMVLGTFDFDEVTGTVQQIGTEIDKELFDSIADDLAKMLVANGGDSRDVIVTFSDATSLANIASGEKHSTIFGKLRKWFTDRISKLKAFAYDANTKITTTDTDSTIPSTEALEDGDITVMNAEFANSASRALGDKNGKDITTYVAVETDPTVPAWAKANTKPSYTKAEVGLGNVDNTADEDKPISTATQNALSAKVDKVSGKQLSTNDYTTSEKNKLAGLATDTVRYGSQTLTDTQKSQARTNIGAGTSSFDGTWGSLQGKPGVVQATGTSTSDVMSQKATTDALNTVQGKIPTKVSQLTNDSGYATQTAVNAKYTKPSDGIPATDLDDDVQASLKKADSALQSAPVTSVNGKTGAVSLKATDVGALSSDTKYVSSVNGSTGAITNIATKAEVNAKQNALTEAQLNAVNSGITSAKVTTYDGYASTINGKQDKLTAGTNISISGATISAIAPSNMVTTDTPQEVKGKKTFSGTHAFTGETQFTHASYAPTFTDIANGVGKSSCFTRGALMQAFVGQIIAPNAAVSDETRAYNIESGKIKFQSIVSTNNGQPTLKDLAVLSSSGLSVLGKTVATTDQLTADTGYTSITTTGSGNAITAISGSGRALTATKGTTFLTSHQSLANYVTLNGTQEITGAKTFTSEIYAQEGGIYVELNGENAFKVGRTDGEVNITIDGGGTGAVPLILDMDAGTSGQVLTSQGAGKTPKWAIPFENDTKIVAGKGARGIAQGVAIGRGTSARGIYGIAIGALASATSGSISIGAEQAYNTSTGIRNIVIGYGCANTGTSTRSIAIGSGSGCDASYGIAIGSSAASRYEGSIAIGMNAIPSASAAATYIGCGIYEQTGRALMLGAGQTPFTYMNAAGASWSSASDIRDKADIEEIDHALDFISKLKPITYVMNEREKYLIRDEENKPILDENGKQQYDKEAHAKGEKKKHRRFAGLSAQDTYKAMLDCYDGNANYAQIVDNNKYDNPDDEYIEQYSMSYERLVPFLIKAIQEQQTQIDELKRQLK